jgi:hypothetical protein
LRFRAARAWRDFARRTGFVRAFGSGLPRSPM